MRRAAREAAAAAASGLSPASVQHQNRVIVSLWPGLTVRAWLEAGARTWQAPLQDCHKMLFGAAPAGAEKWLPRGLPPDSSVMETGAMTRHAAGITCRSRAVQLRAYKAWRAGRGQWGQRRGRGVSSTGCMKTGPQAGSPCLLAMKSSCNADAGWRRQQTSLLESLPVSARRHQVSYDVTEV